MFFIFPLETQKTLPYSFKSQRPFPPNTYTINLLLCRCSPAITSSSILTITYNGAIVILSAELAAKLFAPIYHILPLSYMYTHIAAVTQG